jgi:hypothetical protein
VASAPLILLNVIPGAYPLFQLIGTNIRKNCLFLEPFLENINLTCELRRQFVHDVGLGVARSQDPRPKQEKVIAMKSWKRIATLSLVVTAAFFSLFWVTAFTTEEVANLDPGEATIVSASPVTPTSFSKSSANMSRNKITLHKGSNTWSCLPAVDHRPAGKHPIRRNAV